MSVLSTANISDLDELKVDVTISKYSATNILTSSQTNVQNKTSLDILYFKDLVSLSFPLYHLTHFNSEGLRVVRSSQTCLLTNMETSFDFGKLELDFQYYTRSKKRWDMNFQISVRTEERNTKAEDGVTSQCDGLSLERIVDIDVTQEMFDKLYRRVCILTFSGNVTN